MLFCSGRNKRVKAQVVLEVVAVLVCIAILGIAAMKLFSNMNINLLQRLNVYRSSRIDAVNNPIRLSTIKVQTYDDEPMGTPLSKSTVFLDYFPKTSLGIGSESNVEKLLGQFLDDPRVASAFWFLELQGMTENVILPYRLAQIKALVDNMTLVEATGEWEPAGQLNRIKSMIYELIGRPRSAYENGILKFSVTYYQRAVELLADTLDRPTINTFASWGARQYRENVWLIPYFTYRYYARIEDVGSEFWNNYLQIYFPEERALIGSPFDPNPRGHPELYDLDPTAEGYEDAMRDIEEQNPLNCERLTTVSESIAEASVSYDDNVVNLLITGNFEEGGEKVRVYKGLKYVYDYIGDTIPANRAGGEAVRYRVTEAHKKAKKALDKAYNFVTKGTFDLEGSPPDITIPADIDRRVKEEFLRSDDPVIQAKLDQYRVQVEVDNIDVKKLLEELPQEVQDALYRRVFEGVADPFFTDGLVVDIGILSGFFRPFLEAHAYHYFSEWSEVYGKAQDMRVISERIAQNPQVQADTKVKAIADEMDGHMERAAGAWEEMLAAKDEYRRKYSGGYTLTPEISQDIQQLKEKEISAKKEFLHELQSAAVHLWGLDLIAEGTRRLKQEVVPYVPPPNTIPMATQRLPVRTIHFGNRTIVIDPNPPETGEEEAVPVVSPPVPEPAPAEPAETTAAGETTTGAGTEAAEEAAPAETGGSHSGLVTSGRAGGS